MNSVPSDGGQPLDNPSNVSLGLKLQTAFLGIDSLYVVLEFPYSSVFEFWSQGITDLHDPRLYEGIPVEDFLIRRGGNGYKLSVWDGDARLFFTDRVDDNLKGTALEGQGLGVMLQLGPKWLWKYGDILSPQTLEENILAQLRVFHVQNPANYHARMNRLDITLDVRGLSTANLSMDEWMQNWVGYANRKDFHISATTRQLEGMSIGTSEGVIRFKLYDKVQESRERGTSRFWRSMWGVGEDEDVKIARFEWSIKVYEAKFSNIRYLSDYTFERFMDLLNYCSLKWGRLCVPESGDTNPTRRELAPLWTEIRRLIEEWTISYQGFAQRQYDLRPDLNPAYLKFITGSLAGFRARVGIEIDGDTPASLDEALDLLKDRGLSVDDKAKKKWEIISRKSGRGNTRE